MLVLIALASVLSSGWHGASRNVLADLRFAWDQRQASGEIVVVAIDASSIEKIGIWPWPRRLHAELLRKLENAGVRDIAFDVDFSAPSDPASDQEFVEALRGAGGSVVLPSFKQPGAVSGNPNALHINRPLKQFSDQSWPAFVNVAIEPDGLVRYYPFGDRLGGEFIPSMGAMLAGEVLGGNERPLTAFWVCAASISRLAS